MIQANHIKRTYSGIKGCMCGCKGTYSSSERAKKIAVNKIVKNAASFNLLIISDNEACLYMDYNNRTRVYYLNKDGIDAAKALGFKE